MLTSMGIFRHILMLEFLLLASSSAVSTVTSNLIMKEVKGNLVVSGKDKAKENACVVKAEANDNECISLFVDIHDKNLDLDPADLDRAVATACMDYQFQKNDGDSKTPAKLGVHLQAKKGLVFQEAHFWAGLDPLLLPITATATATATATTTDEDHPNGNRPTLDVTSSQVVSQHQVMTNRLSFDYDLSTTNSRSSSSKNQAPTEECRSSHKEFVLYVSLQISLVGDDSNDGEGVKDKNDQVPASTLSSRHDQPLVVPVVVQCTCQSIQSSNGIDQTEHRHLLEGEALDAEDNGVQDFEKTDEYKISHTPDPSISPAPTISPAPSSQLYSGTGDRALEDEDAMHNRSRTFANNTSPDEKEESYAYEEEQEYMAIEYDYLDDNNRKLETTTKSTTQKTLAPSISPAPTISPAPSSQPYTGTGDRALDDTGNSSDTNAKATYSEEEEEEMSYPDEYFGFGREEVDDVDDKDFGRKLSVSGQMSCIVPENGETVEWEDGEKVCYDTAMEKDQLVMPGQVCVVLSSNSLVVSVSAYYHWKFLTNKLWYGIDKGMEDVPAKCNGTPDSANFQHSSGAFEAEEFAKWTIDLSSYCGEKPKSNLHQITMVSHSLVKQLGDDSTFVVYGYKNDSPDTTRPWFGWFDVTFECECSLAAKSRYLRGGL